MLLGERASERAAISLFASVVMMRGNKSIEIERAIESGHARRGSDRLSLSLPLSALLAPSLTPILELFLDYLACVSENSRYIATVGPSFFLWVLVKHGKST